MKICYVITKADDIGGAQVHVRDLAFAVRKSGSDVLVIVGEYGELTKQLSELELEYQVIPSLKRNLSMFSDIRAVFDIRNSLKKYKPSVISLHSSKAGILGRLASYGLGAKVLFTAHGWAFANGVPRIQALLYRLIERAFSPLADTIVTVSEQDRLLALDAKVASAEKLLTIHNGMPVPVDPVRDRAQNENVRLVMIARFCAQKDHDTLFNALAGISRSSWELDLVGSGPGMESAMEKVSALGLSSRVRFLGQVGHAAKLLKEYDVYLLISNWEGFPRSIIEAMSYGLPVVASDVGGVSEAIDDGLGGVLVSRGNSTELQVALNELIENSSKREAMGEYNYQKFTRHFTFEAMYERTLSLYLS